MFPALCYLCSPLLFSLSKLQHARESLELATRLLSMSTTTADSSQRHTIAGGVVGGISRQFRDSPKNRLRAQTVFAKPKVAEEAGDSIPGDGATTKAKVKSAKKVTRTATFKSKDKDREKEKEKEKDKGGGGHTAVEASEGTRIHEQQFVECITHLKGSLEDMMNETEEKDELIAKLRNEIQSLRESLQLAEQTNISQQQQELQGSSPVLQRNTVRSSPPQPRPYSYHVVLNDEGEGEGQGTGNSAMVDDSRDSTLSPSAISNTQHDDSEYESSDTGTFLVPEHV